MEDESWNVITTQQRNENVLYVGALNMITHI